LAMTKLSPLLNKSSHMLQKLKQISSSACSGAAWE
jgi:hypothetical protein